MERTIADDVLDAVTRSRARAKRRRIMVVLLYLTLGSIAVFGITAFCQWCFNRIERKDTKLKPFNPNIGISGLIAYVRRKVK